MLSRRIGSTLRLAASVLAVAAVAVAGGSLASRAVAGQPPLCDDGTVPAAPAGGGPFDCVDPTTTTSPTTTTDTTAITTVPETPTVTEPAAPAEPLPPPVVTEPTVTAPNLVPATIPLPAPTTTVTDPEPVPAPATTATPSGGDTLGSGSWTTGPPQNGTPALAGGPYVFPVLGASSFSDTWGAARATVAWHHGVDIFAPLGSPIVAVADGVLFSVGRNAIGGQRLWLRDRAGNYFYFAHLSAFSDAAAEGARVLAGTVIGYVGNTGDAEGTPYHLHFEIHPVSLLSLGYDGAVDPFPYVSAWRRLDGPGAGGGRATPAPPAAAILLGFTDISSAGGLSSASVDEMVDTRSIPTEIPVAAAPAGDTQPQAQAASAEEIPPPGEDDARIARSLDTEASRPALAGPGVWDALALCESGGNWSANTGNGFVGGLQFLPQTWASHGGSAFAPAPNGATREQQIAIAERVLESQGWRAWPACSAMLGLRASAHG
jgi:murein DD-endopeptidase MepM/ murein hydrolase activator NlpD